MRPNCCNLDVVHPINQSTPQGSLKNQQASCNSSHDNPFFLGMCPFLGTPLDSLRFVFPFNQPSKKGKPTAIPSKSCLQDGLPELVSFRQNRFEASSRLHWPSISVVFESRSAQNGRNGFPFCFPLKPTKSGTL